MADPLFDLQSEANGDLAVTTQGDFGLATGEDSLNADLKRRFGTPVGALFYDLNYGNPMLARLSQPTSQGFEAACAQDARACVMADPRVVDASASVTVDRESRSVFCRVEYRDSSGGSGSLEEVKVLV
ncbi:hypothetical protein JJB07_14910 [Tumebacillus sp. ITR2]|uniref:Uncharacterized protein n=1 Tax=Tumebacillus amylolyticus TaxID=2801339 RepID=A0ABS1JCG4_9BACL|nr:hypothetical protein [Tumebacillus amylolyticus]MBL0387929.1 hypothetical protein [Tumebacillus amylolyticus]